MEEKAIRVSVDAEHADGHGERVAASGQSLSEAEFGQRFGTQARQFRSSGTPCRR